MQTTKKPKRLQYTMANNEDTREFSIKKVQVPSANKEYLKNGYAVYYNEHYVDTFQWKSHAIAFIKEKAST